MTKEEILETKNWSSEYPNYMAENQILEAMDEFSEQQVISFLNWIDEEKWDNKVYAGRWFNINNSNYSTKLLSTQQLYHLFKNKNKEQ